MAALTFYALGQDQRALWEFLFATTDLIVYESYSRFDSELRQFGNLGELEAAFKLGEYRTGIFQLWSPAVMPRPVIRRIELKMPGHSFRYCVEGVGMIQLELDGSREGVIHHSYFAHWSEAGARQRSMHNADDCDWGALLKLSGQIQRHIKGKLAVAKLRSRWVLGEAHEAVAGGMKLEFSQLRFGAESEEIVAIAKRKEKGE